ncbi:MAG: hypothetical protein GY788_11640 [bacterium]|nr:hypothetical protein [bacterium]
MAPEMQNAKTIVRFGFDLHGGDDESRAPIVRILASDVENIVIGPEGRVANIVISPHLMTFGEIDEYVNSAIAELQKIRVLAKSNLKEANPKLR